MTYEEARELDAGYAAKFGDKYIGQGVKVPTLEETLQLAIEKRPDLLFFGVEIKEYTEECVDLTVELLKKYGVFEKCYFYAFNARIIKYLKTKYNGRTMGYPDFQMKEFQPDSYTYYEDIGLNMNIVKSEILPLYQVKGMPMHMYCADNEADVERCIRAGADLITANDPVPLMKRLGRL
jgi:glycerophosphoryl diester phosphodiesterase